jgi:nucleolar pre-ribosomal-associated protein 1
LTFCSALTSLRNQFTIKAEEVPISVEDERLLLAQNWMSSDPGAQDAFELWERATQVRMIGYCYPAYPTYVHSQNQTSLVTAILGVLSALLTLLSSHYTFHQHGQPVLKTLLSQQWMRRLNSFVRGAHSDLTLVALKLLNAISNFGGGKDRTKLLNSFTWEAKVIFHCT